MIIKGGPRSRAGGRRPLDVHLQLENNEVVQVLDMRGTAATDLGGAFREIEAVASGTKCGRALYHASINTSRDEVLSPEQWRQSVETLEKALKLDGQPRAIVRHVKNGREHVHVVWSRIDAENMRAIDEHSHNYRIHEQVARQLEREFGHREVEGVHTGDKSKPRPVAEVSHDEKQQADRLKLPLETVSAEARAAWDASQNGAEFAANLAIYGHILARGDRRDLVIIDRANGEHSPRRRLGLKAAEIKAHCADLDLAALPSVTEAHELVQARSLETGERESAAAETPERQAPASAAVEQPAADKPNERKPDAGARPEEPATGQAPGSPDIDRRDGAPTIGGKGKADDAGKPKGEDMESPGILSLIFAKVTGLFDFVRHTLFAAAFAPTVEAKRAREAEQEAPQQTAGAPIRQEPARPGRVYESFDPSKIVLPIEREADARSRDAEDGRAREREIMPPPNPLEEPDGGT